MKKIFVNKRYNKLLQEAEANRQVNIDKIKTIGIISTDEISKCINIKEETDIIFDFTSSKIISFKDQIKKGESSTLHFSDKSFGWKGQVKDPNLKSFLDKPFDLLIGYFNKPNLYTELAVLHSKAKFKTGISKVNQSLYELEINEIPKNTERFLVELKKYLQILNKL